MIAATALALPAQEATTSHLDDELEVGTGPHLPDDEQAVFDYRVKVLRRLHPGKARLLAFIAAEMLRESGE